MATLGGRTLNFFLFCFVNLSKSLIVFGPQPLVDLFRAFPTLKSMILILGEMI